MVIYKYNHFAKQNGGFTMDERLINNASFSKICKILQTKKSVWEDVKPILQANNVDHPGVNK